MYEEASNNYFNSSFQFANVSEVVGQQTLESFLSENYTTDKPKWLVILIGQPERCCSDERTNDDYVDELIPIIIQSTEHRAVEFMVAIDCFVFFR